MKNKGAFLIFLLVQLSFSCSTTVHLPVPGEASVKKSSIYAEYMAIADAYSDLAKYDRAAQYYELARKDRRLYWSATYSLGRCLAMNKKYSESLSVYRTLLRRDGGNRNLKLSVAYLYAMNGELELSEAAYEELWSGGEESAEVLENYISVLLASEKYTEAEEKLSLLKEKFSDSRSIQDFEKKLEEARAVENEKSEKNVSTADSVN